MRSRILATLLVPLTVAPAWTAFAQDAQEEEPQPASTETEGQDISDDVEQRPTSVTLPPGAPQGRETAPGQVHTVETGDTLWDLSQRYLGSPWYWPKVWSYNPQIANPHWIYPGNNVKFFPGGEEVPSRVEAGDLPSDDMSAPTDVSGGSLVSVVGKIGYDPSNASPVTTKGFVTTRELDEAGRIEGSTSEALMLSAPEKVYLRFKKRGAAKVGDRYVIFHTVEEVKHPVTNARTGYLTELLGTVQVVSITNDVVTARIMETWDPIARGDLVGPSSEKLSERVAPKPNSKEIPGYVLTPMTPGQTLLGEHNFVVVDRGTADGVQVGNTFTIERRGDPSLDVLGRSDYKMGDAGKGQKAYPWEAVAQCMVTEVRERTSNCLLTRSLTEISAGDRATMRKDGTPTASR
ncbi:LysM peptidoglycan-binding domain-containing protein [Corallococcus aberystwythensis]|uniref:LysM peptidoglycan-binding domain-containing protein n=1 Tax=Corallococcus aberystwythensis TaxID=2316722 RepID=A0A3A8PFR0_9BACT|nr:LysM peptidoglycan-binding domain-containing protein [Corallococcus aberystwythensis]RKH54150.1 LysM peptidoglycan-binding domain-containing protein [Corallococcus aberystwythensis]